MTELPELPAESVKLPVKLNDQGLMPAIAQDINTGQVLMLDGGLSAA